MSTPLLDLLRSTLTEQEWVYDDLSQGGEVAALRVGFQGENGRWYVLLQVQEELEQVLIYSAALRSTPPEQRAAVAEFLTRANYGMRIGNFEMDWDDGEVRYKTSVDVEGGALTPMMVRMMLDANVRTTDRYLPGLVAVSEGHQSAKDAIEAIEQAT